MFSFEAEMKILNLLGKTEGSVQDLIKFLWMQDYLVAIGNISVFGRRLNRIIVVLKYLFILDYNGPDGAFRGSFRKR